MWLPLFLLGMWLPLPLLDMWLPLPLLDMWLPLPLLDMWLSLPLLDIWLPLPLLDMWLPLPLLCLGCPIGDVFPWIALIFFFAFATGESLVLWLMQLLPLRLLLLFGGPTGGSGRWLLLLLLLFFFFFENGGDAVRELESLLPPLFDEFLLFADIPEELPSFFFFDFLLFFFSVWVPLSSWLCELFPGIKIFGLWAIRGDGISLPPTCEEDAKLKIVWVVSWDT